MKIVHYFHQICLICVACFAFFICEQYTDEICREIRIWKNAFQSRRVICVANVLILRMFDLLLRDRKRQKDA